MDTARRWNLLFFMLTTGWLVPVLSMADSGAFVQSTSPNTWANIAYSGTTERTHALLFIDAALKKPQSLRGLGECPNGLDGFTPTFTVQVVEKGEIYQITLLPRSGHGNIYLFMLDVQTGLFTEFAEGFGVPPRPVQ